VTQPGAIYYLILYTLIIVLQFFKTFPKVRDEPEKYGWREYFFVSLQVVYTAAGVIILLLAQLKEWMAVLMMAYVGLIVVSSFLDTVGTRFKPTTRLCLHLAIILFVVVTTVISYEKVLPRNGAASSAQEPNARPKQRYRVVFPYSDATLAKHVGVGRMKGLRLYFATTVEGGTRDEAILRAKEVALHGGEDSIQPFARASFTTSAAIDLSIDEAAVELTGEPSPVSTP
jgi:hypothetical protein